MASGHIVRCGFLSPPEEGDGKMTEIQVHGFLYFRVPQGLRASADLGFWLATDEIEAYQWVGGRFLRTNLELTAGLWGYVRPSQYTGQSGISVQVPGERKRYLVVYPFIKTHDWYQLSADDRRAMMKDNARGGHALSEIDPVLVLWSAPA